MDVLAFMAASREAQQGACSSTLQCPAADSTPPKTRRVDLVEQAKPPISSAPVSAPRIDEPALSTDASRKVLPPPRRSGDLVAPPLQVPPSAWRAARVAPGWLPPTTAAMAAEGLGQCRADVVLVEANLWALATLNAVEAQMPQSRHAMEAVRQAYLQHGTLPGVQRAACWAVSHLASHCPSAHSRAVELGVHVELQAIAATHARSAEVQEAAWKALANLLCSEVQLPGCSPQVNGHTLLRDAQSTMQHHRQATGVQEATCWCVANLTANSAPGKEAA
eukprot:jgi/Tetstr1/460337/TSEL_005637.t1